MLVDSHCHLDQLDLAEYNGQLDSALAFARSHNVGYFLCVCIDMHNFPAVLAIAKKYPNISASVGVHPNEQNSPDPSVEELVEYAQHPEIVAIGETGLDCYRSEGDLEWQRERFRRHIRAAIKTDKPLIVHNRDSGADTIRILKEENAQQVGGVLHCFTDTLDIALQALELNFYISFSGILTFKNAIELQQVATQIPLNRILIETDSPYLAPVPHRGRPNQPGYVVHVAKSLAKLKGVSIQKIEQQTTKNFFRLFKDCNQAMYKEKQC